MTITREHQAATATEQILGLIMDECRYWHGRDDARRGGFANLYAAAKEVADKEAKAAPVAEAVAIHQWDFGGAWMDTDEAGTADARCEGYKTRVVYAAPPHDAELVELLREASWALDVHASCQEGVVAHCVCKKCVITRIDTYLATLPRT